MIVLLFVVLVVLFVALPLVGLALWAFFSVVVVGLVVGALGRLVVPGRQRIGILATVMAGLCGSILGGFIGQHVLHVGHFVTALVEIGVAALVVLALVELPGRRMTRT
jgi:uncharacterized membrane protein YeaQ/YmgE (transglycosylase-associated protein family)